MSTSSVKPGKVIQEKQPIDVLADLYAVAKKANDTIEANSMKSHAIGRYGLAAVTAHWGFK